MAVLLLFAIDAAGSSDAWSCDNYVSAQVCWSGNGYQPWDEVTMGTFA
jgi:hypothetical protein